MHGLRAFTLTYLHQSSYKLLLQNMLDRWCSPVGCFGGDGRDIITMSADRDCFQSIRFCVDICLAIKFLPVELRNIVQMYLQASLNNSNIRLALEMWTGASTANPDATANEEIQNKARMLYGNISYWDTQQVTDMSYLFQHLHNFNESIIHWDVSHVIDMRYMFFEAKNFNQPLLRWKVGNVTSMCGMFQGALVFNQRIDTWDVRNVANMGYMFYGARSFNKPLQSWQLTSVTNMSYMFAYALSFNQSLACWDVSHVLYMKAMFCHAETFSQNLCDWDVSQVVTMSEMFDGAHKFYQKRTLKSKWPLLFEGK